MVPVPEIEPEIRKAIDEAVTHAGQNAALSAKIMAWFSAVAARNEHLADRDAVRRRLDVLLENVSVDISRETEEEE